jgi:hypothetical protein
VEEEEEEGGVGVVVLGGAAAAYSFRGVQSRDASCSVWGT